MRLEQKIESEKKKFKKFSETKKGKKIIFIGLICFLLGVLWKFVFVTALIFSVGYILYTQVLRKENETKKPTKI